MNRRTFLAAALALPAMPALAQTAKPPIRTRWNVIGSEGYDAIAFLGALTGRDLYQRYYAAAVDAFAPKLPADVLLDVPKLAD